MIAGLSVQKHEQCKEDAAKLRRNKLVMISRKHITIKMKSFAKTKTFAVKEQL